MKLLIVAILIVICTTINSTHAQIRSKCGAEEFECQSGQCIRSELLCDGRPDCLDQTDETRTECTKPEIMCPEYAFRCAYGACVDGDATCNGVKDCIDNSDEILPRCRGILPSTVNTSHCESNQVKCNNGQCIESTALCDGTADCIDGSDETRQKCSSFDCGHLVFRCSYGACIDGDLKCNGEVNCADGSDEAPQLCNRQSTVTASTLTSIIIPTPTPPTIPPRRRTCTAPPQPQNGYWKLEKSQCSTGENCDISSGVQLDPGAHIVYRCNPGYKIRGSVDVICGLDGRWLTIPVCVEVRCKGLSSVSTDAVCTYDDEWVSCESPVLPRTVAKLACRNSYRQDVTLLSRQRDRVRCNEKGQWEPEPIRCIPVCGVVSPNAKPLIVNGTRPRITEFPWHASLYKEEGGVKEFICGATIIKDNLLITAAHCVYNTRRKRVDDPRKYYVATGNIFQDFDSPLHDPNIVKKAQVKNIYTMCNYLGLEGNFALDIAILEIGEPFVLSSLLLPACLDPSTHGDQVVLETGSYGKVAGFGRTAYGASSSILQSLTVPYVPLNQCKSSSIALDTERFITIDKFCAGYTNGSSVCDGDSGGGLVFKTGGLWYLRGIVSVALGTSSDGATTTCDSNTYSLYTRISSHIGWIQDVMLKLETYKSFPTCSNGP